eukprot:6492607-Amphidinium_carterae.2
MPTHGCKNAVLRLSLIHDGSQKPTSGSEEPTSKPTPGVPRGLRNPVGLQNRQHCGGSDAVQKIVHRRPHPSYPFPTPLS